MSTEVKTGAATEAVGRAPDRDGFGPWFSRAVLRNGPLGGLIALVVVMAALSRDFLNGQNLLNVGVQASVTAILAFGVTFVIVSAGIDLSVGSVAALSAAVVAWAATSEGLPVWMAVLLGLAVGAVAGLVSGALVAYGKLPAFIATLAMLSVGRGLALVISGGSPIPFPGSVSALGDTLGGWLPVPVLVMIAMGLIAALVLARTYSRPRDVRDRRQRGGGPALRHPRQAPQARDLRAVRGVRRGQPASCSPPGSPPPSRRPPPATSWTPSPPSSSAGPASPAAPARPPAPSSVR